MIGSIRSLEATILLLQNENSDLQNQILLNNRNGYNLKCLTCFPKTNQNNYHAQPLSAWQKPKVILKVEVIKPALITDCQNRFAVLSEDNKEQRGNGKCVLTLQYHKTKTTKITKRKWPVNIKLQAPSLSY